MRQVGHRFAWAEATSRDLMLGIQGWLIPGSNSRKHSEGMFRHLSPILTWASLFPRHCVCSTAGKNPGKAKAEQTSVSICWLAASLFLEARTAMAVIPVTGKWLWPISRAPSVLDG